MLRLRSERRRKGTAGAAWLLAAGLCLGALTCARAAQPATAEPRGTTGLWAGPAGGERPARADRGGSEVGAPDSGSLLRSSLTLSAIVLAFGATAAFVLRLTIGRRGASAAGQGGLRALGSLRLGSKDALHLVRVGSRVLVLATGAGAPQLVERFEGEEADRLEAEVTGAGFAAWLRAARGESRAAALAPRPPRRAPLRETRP